VSSSPKEKRRRAFLAIGRYLARYRGSLIIGGLCLVFSDVFANLAPWVFKLTVDGLKEGITSQRLGTLAALFAGVTVVAGFFRFFMRRIMIGVSRRIELDMRGDFFAHLERLSASFYNKHRTGDLMALATNDLNAVRSLVGPGVMYSLNTLVSSALALSIMIVLSWKLTLVALLPLAILAVGMYYSMKLIHKYFEVVQERFASLNSRAQENLSGVRVVRAYAREEYETDEFAGLSQQYVKANMKLYQVDSLFSPLLTSVAGLGALFILGYGGRLVIDQSITLGTLVAFTSYFAILVWPMVALGYVMNLLERGLASMGRINDVLHTEPDIRDVQPSLAARPRDRSITFEEVWFSYDPEKEREAVLKGVSLTIHDGETVAVVGPTGSGKTSLVSLMLRLYEPQSGRILVGREPIERLPLDELRALIGLVPQDIFLFSQSIAENVSFGVSDLEEPELDRVTRLAAIHEEIQTFPVRYRTMIGERGINLSGGQKQRLAIARALAKDPGILILDDALSSVDADTEEKILTSLREEMKKRTSVLISHRISTVREADRIFVLDDGRLVESGSHSDLIASRGLYADMHEKQQIMYSLERS
jgi:ATP-binding cassette subfamily B protein